MYLQKRLLDGHAWPFYNTVTYQGRESDSCQYIHFMQFCSFINEYSQYGSKEQCINDVRTVRNNQMRRLYTLGKNGDLVSENTCIFLPAVYNERRKYEQNTGTIELTGRFFVWERHVIPGGLDFIIPR